MGPTQRQPNVDENKDHFDFDHDAKSKVNEGTLDSHGGATAHITKLVK